MGALFSELYPRVMIPGTNAAYDLTIKNTVSPPYSLKVMTVVAVVVFPIVVIYQAWRYHIFKKRLSMPRVGSEGDVEAVAPPPGASTPAETS